MNICIIFLSRVEAGSGLFSLVMSAGFFIDLSYELIHQVTGNDAYLGA